MSSSSGSSGPGPKRPSAPQAALDALLLGAAGDPVRRALWLDALDQRLRHCLPEPVAAHAQLANVDRDRLVYLVDAPVWHAKLRMAGPQLLDAARSLGLPVRTLVVRTRPHPAQPAVQPQGHARLRTTPMSAASRRALEAALASLDSEQDGSGHDPD